MGYSYSQAGRLCCDYCGTDQGVRKVPCPFGYCPKVAMCPECKKKHPQTKAEHIKHGCEAGHLEHEARKKEEADRTARGEFLRCSALIHYKVESLPERVKVIFRGAGGVEKAYFMRPETYRAIPGLTPAGVDDYRKIGEVVECESLDIYANV